MNRKRGKDGWFPVGERVGDVPCAPSESEPARDRKPMTITEVYLGQVTIEDFRRNPRGELGTRTATLHKEGIRRFRENWVYRVD